MVLVYAHPDDESFCCGGTIAAYARNGWDIHLLCATAGEAGMTGPLGGVSKEQLKEARKAELEGAAKILGITTVTVYDYTDGGLKALEAGDLEDVLYKDIREYQPDVVVTFEPQGISNHPDHMKVSRSATFAYQKYAFEKLKPAKRGARDPRGLKKAYHQGIAYEDVEGDGPKLYYTCIPQSVSEYLVKKDVVPKESFGKPWNGVPDKYVTTIIDIRETVQQKIDALAAHVSQEDDVRRFFSVRHHPLLSNEYYILRMHGYTEVYMGKHDTIGTEL